MSHLLIAYELDDKPDSALMVFQKFCDILEIQGKTELLHPRILEAKLQIRKNPDWLYSNKVINLDSIQPTEKNSIPYSRNVNALNTLQGGELHQRIQLTSVPDLLLANVLNEIADATARSYSLQRAYIFYFIALRYDPTDTYGIKAKLDNLTRELNKCGIEVPDEAMTSYCFPPVDSVEGIPYAMQSQMKRVLQFQEEELKKNKKTFLALCAVAAVAVLGLVFFLYFRKNYDYLLHFMKGK